MKESNPVQDRLYRLEQAREAFTKAAAATYDVYRRSGAIVEVVFFAALGTLRVAQADPEEEGMRGVIEVVDRVRAERGAVP